MQTLQETDYKWAAGLIGVETAVIKAVLEVETGNRGGFVAEDKPAILFEGHIFWRQLRLSGIDPMKHQQGNEDILYPKWTKAHYKGGIQEYDRLDRAKLIHEEAALLSTSWGLAQIMGFNYKLCDCKSIHEFVWLMSESEGRQLYLFVNFIRNNRWDSYLRCHDWNAFARCYNGPAYAKNRYGQKLAAAYAKYKR